jgi:C4-dicarboxylate-specific signal transduction histidine kinase
MPQLECERIMVDHGRDIAAKEGMEAPYESAGIDLVRVARTNATTKLAASVAHEISQPLTSILANGYASQRWLAMQPPQLDEAREAVAQIVGEADRACKVIAGIRDLLAKKPLRRLRVDVHQIILQVLALTSGELKSCGITVRIDFPPDLPLILGDPVQLQQVMFNLVANSIDAMNSARNRPKELSIRSVTDSFGLLVEFRDSGIGLQAGSTEGIFEPFVTTKSQGLGLGLSISRSIIEAHGGRLWATAEESHGAVFQLTLPKVRDSR